MGQLCSERSRENAEDIPAKYSGVVSYLGRCKKLRVI
jgi:hypothetical protein